jgi:hypothetical protein
VLDNHGHDPRKAQAADAANSTSKPPQHASWVGGEVRLPAHHEPVFGLDLDESDGRRQLRMAVGPYRVTVTEIPGRNLTALEWHDIQLARRSYAAMWGVPDRLLSHDPLDGRERSPYDAWHYLAWVRERDQPARLLTLRRVQLDPGVLTAERRADPADLLLDDIRFWRVQVEDTSVPLWGPLRALARRLLPDDESPEFRIAAMDRLATFPFGHREPSAVRRQGTVVAWAAIQLLATHGDSSPLLVCTIRPELRDRVLAVRDAAGETLTPPFALSEEMLGLPAGSVGLDNALPLVRAWKLSAPGLFVHNDDAAHALATLLQERRITIADLRPAIGSLLDVGTGERRLLASAAAIDAATDHRRLAAALTRPRAFKHLIPLFRGGVPLSRMSAAELRTRVLFETADGPLSCTVLPRAWADGAWALLEAVEASHRTRRC